MENTQLLGPERLHDLVLPSDNEDVAAQRGEVASPGLQWQGQEQEPHPTLQALGTRSQPCISMSCTGQVLHLAVSGFIHGKIFAHVPATIRVPLNNRQLCAGTTHATLEAHIIIIQFYR